MNNLKFITASAGSGKTYRLMELMANKVAPKEGVPAIAASSLLATTFTEKAAAELRSRVRAKLIECGLVAESQDVLTGLVGTINSVCGRLVEEYAFELGLPPDLKVIASGDDDGVNFERLIFDRAVDGVCADCEGEIATLAVTLDLMPEGNDKKDDWKKIVRRIVQCARYNDISDETLTVSKDASIEWVKKMFDGEDECSYRKTVKDFVNGFRKQLDDLLNKSTQDTYKFTETFLKSVENFDKLSRDPSWKEIYEFVTLKEKDRPKKPGKDNLTNAFQSAIDVQGAMKALWENGIDTLPSTFMHDPELQVDAVAFVEKVFEIAEKCMKAYENFKRQHGLIDYVDQIILAHRLFSESESFRSAFKERVKAVMVDEFQDISPIELSLFLKMCELIPDVTFVGDPKQSIYGFKGTDPALMEAMLVSLRKDGDGADIENLPYSWRSKRNLIEFTNEIFASAFTQDGMDEKTVRLSLPTEHQGDEWQGGEIEAWTLAADSKVKQWPLLAEALVDFVNREQCKDSLCDIAVLLRTNKECEELAEALSKRGVPASTGAGELKDQLECQLAMAAYRYAINQGDTVALSILSAYFMSPTDWIKNISERMDDLRIVALGKVGDRTPLEMLDWAIGAIGLPEDLARREDADRRFRNLDELRALCSRYMTESSLGGYPATPSGFVAYVSRSKDKCASANGGNCIQVLTYHKAKGLEWPTVILGSLESDPAANPFAVTVVSSEQFDTTKPLHGRYIRFAPNPLGNKLSAATTKERMSPILMYLCQSNFCKEAFDELTEEGWREMRRLMYVGMTRAKSRMIFAARYSGDVFETLWLKKLDDNVVFNWDTQDFNVMVVDDSEERCFPIKVRDFTKPNASGIDMGSLKFLDDLMAGDYRTHHRAYDKPSGESSTVAGLGAVCISALSSSLKLKTNTMSDDSAEFGNAVHNYYATTVCGTAPFGNDDAVLAATLLDRWGVVDVASAESLVESGRTLRSYVNANWPNAKISTEVPMTYRDENGTCYQGFIDMLLEVDGGYVLIDHKTGASSAYQSVVEKYAGQQLIYKKAIEKATGKKVLKTILHLPVRGVCVEFELP